MYSERLQILVSPEQRRTLEREARARGESLASMVREAIDARYSTVTPAERRQALDRILAMRAEALPIDELNALIDARYDGGLPRETDR